MLTSINSKSLLETHGLKQHVLVPTHREGHHLDVVITRSESNLLEGVPNVRVSDIGGSRNGSLLDHYQIDMQLVLAKSCRERRVLTFRQFKGFSLQDFRDSLADDDLDIPPESSLNETVERFSAHLENSLNDCAPVVTKEVTLVNGLVMLIIRPNRLAVRQNPRCGKADWLCTRRYSPRSMCRTLMSRTFRLHKVRLWSQAPRVRFICKSVSRTYYNPKSTLSRTYFAGPRPI